MGHQVFLPGRFHGRLEGQNQHLFKAHALGQLIGRKGFAKTHFGIPQELWGAVGKIFFCGGKIFNGFINGLFLFGAHGKGLGAVFNIGCAGFDGYNGSFDILCGAAKPFAADVVDLFLAQNMVNVMVGKAGAVIAHGGFSQDDFIRHHAVRAFGGVLLRHALFHIFFGIAHLQQTLVLRVAVGIGIDHRVRFGALGKELVICHYSSPA